MRILLCPYCVFYCTFSVPFMHGFSGTFNCVVLLWLLHDVAQYLLMICNAFLTTIFFYHICREGAIKTSDDRLTLVPMGERVPMEAQPYSGKSPKGWRAPEGVTLFVGNLAFTVDNMRYV